MNICHAHECINHNRHNPPSCTLEGGAVIGVGVLCVLFEPDYAYRKAQAKERDKLKPWNKTNAGRIPTQSKRVLICGDRNWSDEETIENYIQTLPPHSVVIQGRCKGADKIARGLALKYGHSVMDFPAKWGKNGRAAGPIRNTEMLDKGEPDLVVAFHDNIEESKGTKDMIEQTVSRGIPHKIIMSTGAEK